MRAALVGLAFLAGMSGADVPAHAQQGQWQNYFSDSTEVKSGFCSNGISGMRVDGTWAANNSFYCRHDDTGLRASPDIPFKPSISEERPNNAIQCGPQEAIVGMKCSGLYCDNVAVQCAPLDTRRYALADGGCHWLGPISDTTTRQVTSNGLLTGMKCDGGYCVNKSLHFCQVRKVEPKAGDNALNARWEQVCTGNGTCSASVSKSFVASNEAEESISQTTTATLATSIEAGDGLFTSASVSASVSTDRNTASRILRARSTGTDSGCAAETTPGAGTALVWRRIYEGKTKGIR